MFDFWNTLTAIQKIFFVLAAPSSIILIMQLITTLIGFGNSGDADFGDSADLDTDLDTDSDFDSANESSEVEGNDYDLSDSGTLRLFTLKGIMAFCSIGGWVGLLIETYNVMSFISILGALVSGFLAMYLIAKIIQLSSKLQSSGNINIKNALGKIAEVYVTIPPKGKGSGKINVTIDGRLREYDAITNNDTGINYGALVRITDVIEPDILVVEDNNDKY